MPSNFSLRIPSINSFREASCVAERDGFVFMELGPKVEFGPTVSPGLTPMAGTAVAAAAVVVV